MGNQAMEVTVSIGIDYGRGKTNIDLATGIRFGVISQNEVLQAWADSSEPHYRKGCGFCGEDLGEEVEEGDSCPGCGKELQDLYAEEASFFFLNDSEYEAVQGDDGDIFIERSPYYSRAAFCSPCAPGAGYVMNTVEDGIKAYCFGHDFFDNEKAPYPVYSVESGELV
jgi:hypothetical protein